MPGLPHLTVEPVRSDVDRVRGDDHHRPYVRWSLWLAAGMAAGLVAGFAVGLGRPRPRQSSTGAW